MEIIYGPLLMLGVALFIWFVCGPIGAITDKTGRNPNPFVIRDDEKE